MTIHLSNGYWASPLFSKHPIRYIVFNPIFSVDLYYTWTFSCVIIVLYFGIWHCTVYRVHIPFTFTFDSIFFLLDVFNCQTLLIRAECKLGKMWITIIGHDNNDPLWGFNSRNVNHLVFDVLGSFIQTEEWDVRFTE